MRLQHSPKLPRQLWRHEGEWERNHILKGIGEPRGLRRCNWRLHLVECSCRTRKPCECGNGIETLQNWRRQECCWHPFDDSVVGIGDTLLMFDYFQVVFAKKSGNYLKDLLIWARRRVRDDKDLFWVRVRESWLIKAGLLGVTVIFGNVTVKNNIKKHF